MTRVDVAALLCFYASLATLGALLGWVRACGA